LNILHYFITKANNQVSKITKWLERKKLRSFIKRFKSHGRNIYVGFPIKIEGIEHITLGNNVGISSFVHIWGHGGVTIGDDTLIASHVSIITVTHDTNALKFRESTVKKPINIGRNVWIGSHAVIMPGVTIGDNVIVGAGSVVTKDLTSNAVYVGSPAKKLKDLFQFEE
jgi:maltose O-acetyltransferase